MTDELFSLPAYKISELVRKREISAVEVAKKFAAHIPPNDREINSFLLLT